MNVRRCSLALFAALALAHPAVPDDQGQHAHHHPAGEAGKLGRVEFEVSCSPAARETFERAVAMLHSFWYDEAEKAFAEAGKADPGCAMAHWGVAMTLFHPIWAAANPAAAPSAAELERGRAAIAKAQATGAPSPRERDWIAATAAFYAASEAAYPARAEAWEKAMQDLHARHPQDREAGVFYALALLGNAPPTDKTYARQKQAAEILNRLLPAAPQHPGIAHYLIHSFDYPQLAQYALPAARAYSKIAAASPHALHMPSHIFTRLALWDDSIQSNRASADTARRHVTRTRPGVSSFDELHALDYLAYAYLQQGRDEDARRVLDELRAVRALDANNFAAAYALAAAPARFALERRQWAEAAALTVGPDWFPWDRFRSSEAIVQFARGLGAARAGNLSVAREALGRLQAIQGELASRDAYGAGQADIQAKAVGAWIARAEGRNDEAVALLSAAADQEDATEKHPVTPGAVIPAREQLGDLLLETGRPVEALQAYEAVLRLAPGRFNSVAGGARAAEAAGRQDRARVLYGELLALAGKARAARPELAKARAVLSRRN